MLDGPPCMSRKMMRLALGAKCGVFGASGDSEASKAGSPRRPNPAADWWSRVRRDNMAVILQLPRGNLLPKSDSQVDNPPHTPSLPCGLRLEASRKGQSRDAVP